MLLNVNNRAFCRECKVNIIPVHREVTQANNDSKLQLRCPMCGTYKITMKESVSDEENELISVNAEANREVFRVGFKGPVDVYYWGV